MLKTRVLTAVLGVPLLLFLVYLGGYWYGAAVGAISVAGVKEFFNLMRKGGWAPVEVAGYIFIPLSLLAVFRGNFPLILYLWVLVFAFFCLLPVFSYTKFRYWDSAATFWGILYTGGLASFLLAIRLLPEGLAWTIFLLFVVWSEDVLSYLVGTFRGKTPLVPQLSPKKTIEGAVGGLTASAAAGMILTWLLELHGLTLLHGALLGLGVGTVAVLGDLKQSALKRSVEAKDSGALLPGHGGVLDRFDSMLFAAPFLYIYIYYLA